VLTSLGFLGFFVALEDELAVVHDLAHRGTGVGSDLDQVEPSGLCDPSCFIGFDDADLLAVGVDDADWREADAFVDTMIRLRGWFSEKLLATSDTGPPLLLEPEPGEISCCRAPAKSRPESFPERMYRVQTI
jgi:hypothetical protein